MGVSETQLKTWTTLGSVQQSSETYNSIKSVLEHKESPYTSKNIDVFLQGSYGNDTNIIGDSDVDIVLRTKSFFHYHIGDLPAHDQAVFKRVHANESAYKLKNFKEDVSGWLAQKYGDDFDKSTSGKVFKIKPSGQRRSADVLPAAQYRKYTKFQSEQPEDQHFHEGILFQTSDGKEVVNYPKQHSENMTRAHQATNGWLKPTVRIYKNMRNRMVDGGYIKAGVAPSYFIEGLLYNVPAKMFGTSYVSSMEMSFNWIGANPPAEFTCANGIYPLIFDRSSTSWSTESYISWLRGMERFWNDWT